jgi:hypothetical protein
MSFPPLVYRPANAGRNLTVKRLAVDLLLADAREHRFLVTSVLHDDEVLVVATSDLIRERILVGPRSRHDGEDSWGGETPSHKGSDREGGSWTQRFRGREWFESLLRSKSEFLATLGPEVDLLIQRSAGPIVQRVTLRELQVELEHRGPRR